MTLPTYHIWHDTPEGRLPFTYFVFGPYKDGTYDVEVHRDHIEETWRDNGTYLGTVSELTRNTHVVIDVWDWMDEHV